MDGADSRTGRETGSPITITVFVSGKMARGRKASGTQGSNERFIPAAGRRESHQRDIKIAAFVFYPFPDRIAHA